MTDRSIENRKSFIISDEVLVEFQRENADGIRTSQL